VKTVLIDILLALLVASSWLGAYGFARLPSALSRLHCASFVGAAGGAALTIAAFVSDGASTRALKTLLLLVLLLLTGAALSHAAGRALVLRDRNETR